jgi:cellulose biosynthesis protein BcsQ
MTRIIAVVNMKGGVGKTSTVISLADAIGATSRSSVLVIDVDTQANASYCLLGEELRGTISSGKTVDTFLRRALTEKPAPNISEYIRRNVSNTVARSKQANISLLASSTDLRVSEREVIRDLSRSGETLEGVEVKLLNALRHHIATLGDEFDYIIVDYAPGISPFTSAAIGLADLIVLPTIPDFLSDLGLHSFVTNFGPNLPFAVAKKKPRVLFTRSQGARKEVSSLEPGSGQERDDQHPQEV